MPGKRQLVWIRYYSRDNDAMLTRYARSDGTIGPRMIRTTRSRPTARLKVGSDKCHRGDGWVVMSDRVNRGMYAVLISRRGRCCRCSIRVVLLSGITCTG